MGIVKRIATGLVALFLAYGQAGAIVIDGDLNDWLLHAPTGSAQDWLPADPAVKFQVDDDRRNYLNPGYGGQAYDAEAMYVALDEDNLYVAVVTGLAPGTDPYPAGDILIDGAFDIGGPRSFEVAIVVEHRQGFTVGDVVLADKWGYGLWNGPKDEKKKNEAPSEFYLDHPTIAVSGQLLSTDAHRAQVYYGPGRYDGKDFNGNSDLRLGEHDRKGRHDHYVIEALIPRDLLLLGDGTNLLEPQFLVHWTMQCNNDFLEVDPPLGSTSVPVAPAWVLMLGGMLALIRVRGSMG